MLPRVAPWTARSQLVLMVMSIVFVASGLMVLIEQGEPDSDIDSFPTAIYFVVVTFSTVGYGDISPVTTAGGCMASASLCIGNRDCRWLTAASLRCCYRPDLHGLGAFIDPGWCRASVYVHFKAAC